MRKIFKYITVLILFGLLGLVGYHYYGIYQKHLAANARIEARPPVQKVAGTSISPAFHSNLAFERNLERKYPFIAQAAFKTPQAASWGKQYVVPGLLSTRSYDFEEQKLTPAHNMTPQGLTIAGNYVLISAYDGDYIHSSVIYVLELKTGKFIKTIILPGRPHAGGLAYDPVGKKIWITGSKDEGAILASFSLSKLEAFDYDKNHQPIKYDVNIMLPTLERASTVTYFDNQLFVAFFNVYDKGRVESFNIARSGPQKNSITDEEIKQSTGLSMSYASGQTMISNQIQGIAVTSEHIFLTKSYGGSNSKLYIFPISAARNLNEKNAEHVIEMPPYLEQVYAKGNQLMFLFESGAKKYARDTITIMDRVLSMNLNGLLNSF